MRMVTIKSELKTYGELDDFIIDNDYFSLFREIFGFNFTNGNVKRNLKKHTTWISDIEIIEKILDTLPDRYVVGEWGHSEEIWTGGSYAMYGRNIIWVHKLGEE